MVLQNTAGDLEARCVVNCAGLHCDRVAKLGGTRSNARIVPFRGEYYELNPDVRHWCRNLIYPVPDPKFPFLGVHFTRLIHGGVECGPNAVLAFAREGYTSICTPLRPACVLKLSAETASWSTTLRSRRTISSYTCSTPLRPPRRRH